MLTVISESTVRTVSVSMTMYVSTMSTAAVEPLGALLLVHLVRDAVEEGLLDHVLHQHADDVAPN